MRLHWVEAGSGPLVVLLHGFPEFWYSWRQQIRGLAAAGFHVVAPDLRGYNLSDKPSGVRHYRLSLLVGDVVNLIRHLGEQRAAVVGHDWGGAIAWNVAIRRPDVLTRLAILNAPHPQAFQRELRTPAQLLRSLYILFFQLPWLPELLLRSRNFRFLDRMLTEQPVRPDTFSPEDIKAYKEALGRPGALTAALNYYRAVIRYGRDARSGSGRIDTPTLLIWGERDPYLGVRLTQGLEAWVPHLQVVRLPNASHWVQNDAAEQVTQLLVTFLR